MKALVTGATGFVGSHLVEALASRGDDVSALVRSPGKADLLNRLGVRQVRGDLHDKAALAEAVRDRDVIYHVAGVTAARDEAEFLKANGDGTRNLVAAAEPPSRGAAEPRPSDPEERDRATGERGSPLGPRFVLVSSMAAGGPSARSRPLQGDEPPRPVTAYGRSKLAGEAAVRASRLRWTIVRPPMVYGPRDTEVLKVFKLVRTGIVPVFGDGTQELSAVTGPDLAQALIAAGSADMGVGRTYYACHPEVFTSEQFAHAVGSALDRRVRVIHLPLWLATAMLSVIGGFARAAGKATILTPDKTNEFFQPAWTGDPSPLMRDTGWAPAQDLTTGLARTAAWYRGAGWI